MDLGRRIGAEAICSGMMAEGLASGNVAVALLGHTLGTMLGPVSGVHFNAAVTLVFALRHDLS